MQFGILGPVQVSGPAGIVEIGGARQRRLLAALILHVDGVASTDRLLEITPEEWDHYVRGDEDVQSACP